jgi:hypothetical protein
MVNQEVRYITELLEAGSVPVFNMGRTRLSIGGSHMSNEIVITHQHVSEHHRKSGCNLEGL